MGRTKTALDALRCELREAVKTEDVNRVVTVCENILKWGGAAAHNVRYLHRRQPVLVRELQHLHDLLSRNRTPSKRDLCREPALLRGSKLTRNVPYPQTR